jgi:hypothetical protein
MFLVTNIIKRSKNIPKHVIGQENCFKKISMWFMENHIVKNDENHDSS